MVNGKLHHCFYILCTVLILFNTEAINVGIPITYVEKAVPKGAVCLDGSAPAYHLDKGFGAGINKWLLHIQGGGWCYNVTDCLNRTNTHVGSSKKMSPIGNFSGILSNNQQFNPDFYNWNRVFVKYCDGASFTGDVEAVDPATNLHFRGARVFVAVMGDLLAKGMKNAKYAVLSGCSAGGLTVILHCDSFRDMLPLSTKVKCVADAGYFINVKDVSGAQHIQALYSELVNTHGSAKNLPVSCTSKMNANLCFFPQYIVQQISTPIFLVNAAYDTWQIKNILVPSVADPHGFWTYCMADLTRCSASQLQTMQGFRLEFLSALSAAGNSSSRGIFVNSCFTHCQMESQATWLWNNSPMLDGKTVAKAVGDWVYDRSPFEEIDCPYPCDKTCHNNISDPPDHTPRATNNMGTSKSNRKWMENVIRNHITAIFVSCLLHSLA